MQTFTLTGEHVKLLRRANVMWEDAEFGAPAIDCKRPYGNSSVYHDIAGMLNILFPDEDKDEEFTQGQFDYMDKIHRETETALQIALATGQRTPGEYEAEEYTNDWHRKEA